ncbi:oxidative stress-induced growth inhibitor 2-like isoform X2 [Copidosoma floridanum]|uniref:oxidative stress-induced growth inhibitor 2-like isoform X2 n=1 Tax=Copidosoma floridanum TaxID=29053 RepID=UPI000C6F5AD9|nr:oxidative stress-induced growth inhibitor 2-like isoform X2 [Copidosoma floridanum]
MQQQEDHQSDIFKNVVIIGNGPSGICLSYLLAGNWPHYTGEAHPGDEMLTARLRYSLGSRGGCFVERSSREELDVLSAGLEGRHAGRPLSLLMDQLQHPCLDAGLDVPSLLEWPSPDKHSTHRPIDHVVLGKGSAGGCWNTLDPNVLTISLGRWMSLPGYDFGQWESSLSSEERRQKFSYLGESAEIGNDFSYSNASRVPIGLVAAYYRDYVIKQSLDKYFHCGTVVTSVRPVPGTVDSTTEYGWLVQGYESESGRSFQYRCRRVVLASGATDLSNHLGVSGEDTYNWVTHDLKSFERMLDQTTGLLHEGDERHQCRRRQRPKPKSCESVLVVGSGLSAADAIMAARSRGVPVLHVFRSRQQQKSRSLDRLQWLPASVYPEYHEVYEMMNMGLGFPLYRSLADHIVVEFSAGADKYARTKTRKVTLCTPQGRLVTYRLAFAAVLIGSKPDLSYLHNGGVGLGKVVDKPVDNRTNQVDVDVFGSWVQRAPRKGLYAIGPLAGDNFVRFILGGALAVLADIVNAPE